MVQVASPPKEGVDARRERVGEMVADAAGADIVLLPELWAPGYSSFDRYEKLAEPLDGDTVAAGREWARNLSAYIHLGSVLERTSGGALHNTAVLIDPTGEVVHTYRKIHVFGYRSKEAELLTPGTDISVVKTPLGALSATTCYDLRFPELWRTLVDAGAETVLIPAAWPRVRREHWQLFTSVRAVENQVLIIACNAAGGSHDGTPGGYSRIVDPWGRVLVEADDKEAVISCDLDPGVIARTRTEFPVLADRRRNWDQRISPAPDQRLPTAPTSPTSPTSPAQKQKPEPAPAPTRHDSAPLRLRTTDGDRELELRSPRLIVAGYTGRDEAAVRAHIDELATIGIPAPATVPTFYDLDSHLLTSDAVIEVDGAMTSGEVEPVLIHHDGHFYLGMGSDHTDRKAERHDVAASKAACPKPLSPYVISLPDKIDDLDWDAITVESSVDGTLYQRGALASLRSPRDLLAKLIAHGGEIPADLVLFGGTLPLLGTDFVAGNIWQLTLTTRDHRLAHTYEVKRRTK